VVFRAPVLHGSLPAGGPPDQGYYEFRIRRSRGYRVLDRLVMTIRSG